MSLPCTTIANFPGTGRSSRVGSVIAVNPIANVVATCHDSSEGANTPFSHGIHHEGKLSYLTDLLVLNASLTVGNDPTPPI